MDGDLGAAVEDLLQTLRIDKIGNDNIKMMMMMLISFLLDYLLLVFQPLGSGLGTL